MRVHATGTDDGGHIVVVAVTNCRSDPSRRLCDAYRAVVRKVVGVGMTLEPFVWAGAPSGAVVRIPFSIDEEPGLHAAVAECGGYAPGEWDVLVGMDERMLTAPAEAMPAVVIQDVASILADESIEDPRLGWAAREIFRASVAAVMTRAATPLLLDADGAYAEICACALSGLMAGERDVASFVRRHPGLVSLLDAVVAAARSAPPLPLPLVIDDVAERADAALDAVLSNRMLAA